MEFMDLVSLLIVTAWSASNVAAAPVPRSASELDPVDLVVVLDAQNADQFDTAIMFAQDMAAIPGSDITVLSTSHNEPLLYKENVDIEDSDFKRELSEIQYKSKNIQELTLTSLNKLMKGHFNNDDHNHRKAQILCILTGHQQIAGDTALIQETRRVKTFVVGLGFSSDKFSAQFSDLAADEDHVMSIQTTDDLGPIIFNWKQILAKDSHFVCDTDKYNNPTMRNCYSRCQRICVSTHVLQYDLCRDNCPYFKEVNLTKYIEGPTTESNQKEPSSSSTSIIVTVTAVAIPIIAILFLLFLLVKCWPKLRKVNNRCITWIDGRLCKFSANMGRQDPIKDEETSKMLVSDHHRDSTPVQATEQATPADADTTECARSPPGPDLNEGSDFQKIEHVAEALNRDEIVNGGDMNKVHQ